MKKFWKYLLITILLLIGLFGVCLLYLFFVPGSELFGIRYVSYNESILSASYDSATYSSVEVNSRSYPVKVVKTESDKISVKVQASTLGYVLVKNSTVKIDAEVKHGVLIFDITEAYGAAFMGQSYIEIRLPEGAVFDLKLTNKSAETTIDSEQITLNNFYYATTNGRCDINNITLNASGTGIFTADLNKAIMTVGADTQVNSVNASIKMTSGKFDSSNAGGYKKITLSGITSGQLLIKSCDEINGKISSSGGQIKINEIGYANIESSDTNIEIGTISQGGIISLDSSGKVYVKNINALTLITTKNGEINIDNATEKVYLESNNGNIRIGKCEKVVSAKTSNGNIDIAFASAADSYLSNEEYRRLIVETNGGTIKASGVENIKATITGSGTLELHMNNVYSQNTVTASSGSVYVKINAVAVYTLTTKSNSGNVSVNLAEIVASGGYTTKAETTTPINGSTGTNIFNITTSSGSLTVRDTIVG